MTSPCDSSVVFFQVTVQEADRLLPLCLIIDDWGGTAAEDVAPSEASNPDLNSPPGSTFDPIGKPAWSEGCQSAPPLHFGDSDEAPCSLLQA